MLFTRCPDCDTTFRVTDEALKKANGQVRCGRCASVFNAYSELRDPHTGAEVTLEPPPAPPPRTRPPEAVPTETASSATARTASTTAAPTAGVATAGPKPSTATPPPAPPQSAANPSVPNDERAESISIADVVKQVETAAADGETDPEDIASGATEAAQLISAEQVHRVLESDRVSAGAPWPLDVRTKHPSRWWSVAALLALAALGVQLAHHFRADLVRNAVAGPYVKQAYELVGMDVVPHWNIRQYAILDWVATAEPNARGQGSLKITARIQNRGPDAQPYPSVHLRLKDRWESAVGSRIFGPAEYLGAAAQTRTLMTPGETVRAELEVVDPGPDAYGFELDVCIEIETDQISCGNDKVFL